MKSMDKTLQVEFHLGSPEQYCDSSQRLLRPAYMSILLKVLWISCTLAIQWRLSWNPGVTTSQLQYKKNKRVGA